MRTRTLMLSSVTLLPALVSCGGNVSARPESGTTVIQGLSAGDAAPNTMPNVIGKSVQDARYEAGAVGIDVTAYYDVDARQYIPVTVDRRYTVVRTVPAAGAMVRHDDPVTLYLHRNPGPA